MAYSNVDYIAERLMHVAALGKSMPPSWDGAKIMIPVVSPDGSARIGKILPGRGLYLDSDLKSVGILKRLPFVYEKTPVQRLADFFKSERAAVSATAIVQSAFWFSRSRLAHLLSPFGPLAMQAITTYDGIINARAGGNAYDVTFSKVSITSATNAWSALFDTGGLPGAGSFTATPGAVCNYNTAGSLSFGLPALTGGNKLYILTFGFTSSAQLNMVILADLLSQVGAVAVAGAAATVSSTALTRYTSGNGVLMTWEVTTALGGTPSNLTVSYTNQAGTAAQSTGAVAMTTSAIVGRLQPAALGPYMGLAAGDFGVRAVATATTSASMVGGAIALHLYYPLAMVPGVGAQNYIERDSTIQIDGLTELTNASGTPGCLTTYVLTSGASTGLMVGFLRSCVG
jgi:hypothetical protein